MNATVKSGALALLSTLALVGGASPSATSAAYTQVGCGVLFDSGIATIVQDFR